MGYEIKDLPGPFPESSAEDEQHQGEKPAWITPCKVFLALFILGYAGILYGVYVWRTASAQTLYEKQAVLEQQIGVVTQELSDQLPPPARQKLGHLLELIAQRNAVPEKGGLPGRNLAWGGQSQP